MGPLARLTATRIPTLARVIMLARRTATRTLTLARATLLARLMATRTPTLARATPLARLTARATTVKRNLPPNQQSRKHQLPKPVQTTPAGDRPEATKERSTADEAATGLPKGPASGADVKVLKASLPLLHAQKSAERAHCKIIRSRSSTPA